MLMGTWADTVRDRALLVPARSHTSSLRGILSLKLCEVDTPTFTATSSTVLRLLSLVECRQPSFHQEVPTKVLLMRASRWDRVIGYSHGELASTRIATPSYYELPTYYGRLRNSDQTSERENTQAFIDEHEHDQG